MRFGVSDAGCGHGVPTNNTSSRKTPRCNIAKFVPLGAQGPESPSGHMRVCVRSASHLASSTCGARPPVPLPHVADLSVGQWLRFTSTQGLRTMFHLLGQCWCRSPEMSLKRVLLACVAFVPSVLIHNPSRACPAQRCCLLCQSACSESSHTYRSPRALHPAVSTCHCTIASCAIDAPPSQRFARGRRLLLDDPAVPPAESCVLGFPSPCSSSSSYCACFGLRSWACNASAQALRASWPAPAARATAEPPYRLAADGPPLFDALASQRLAGSRADHIPCGARTAGLSGGKRHPELPPAAPAATPSSPRPPRRIGGGLGGGGRRMPCQERVRCSNLIHGRIGSAPPRRPSLLGPATMPMIWPPTEDVGRPPARGRGARGRAEPRPCRGTRPSSVRALASASP